MLNDFLESVTLDNIIDGKMILIDKPIEWTSFDVVKYVRKSLQTKLKVKKIKVGHAGTLDPLATGLLIICIGKETKNISKYQDLTKIYTGIIKLGETTPSYDRETEIDETYDYDHVDENKVLKISKKFIGRQKQLPPIYSALKKDGRRMYNYAREKIKIDIEPREIEVYDFQILNFSKPHIEFIIECSKGTYIRSIARDLGAKLGCGAHLSGLIRTSQEKFMLSDACSLDDINLEDIISLEKAFEDLDFIKLNEKDSKAFIHGRSIERDFDHTNLLRVYDSANQFIAIGKNSSNGFKHEYLV